jgi:hypothetical protein
MTSGEGVARRFPSWPAVKPAAVRSGHRHRAARPREARGTGRAQPELAVIQFYALTVYPHVVRSMFGISLDPQATEELLTSGVNTFLCYYRPAARSRQPAPDSLAPIRKA